MNAGPPRLPDVRTDRFDAFSHVVSSRQGLFLVNQSRCERLATGAYFGLTFRAGAVFAFERGPAGDEASSQGRVLRFSLNDALDRVVEVEQVAKNLDRGCHQIDFIGDRLNVIDTHRQQLLVYDQDMACFECRSPVPIAGTRDTEDPGYVHMNAVVARGDRLWFMLHNSGKANSEIIRTDAQMEIQQRLALAYGGCHDIVPLEDGELLFCGSNDGVIASTDGRRVQVIPGLMTRGLSVSAQCVVVGSSVFGPRHLRPGLPGVVSFLARDLNPVSHVAVPGSPTDILCIRSEDLSLSR